MKKILSFIIIAVLCLGVLSSCDVINGLINPHTHNYVGGVCECGEVDPNATFYPERAAEYIVTQYNKVNPVTAADYEVYGQVRVGGVVYTVDWSVDNELVKLVDNGSTWLVNVDEKSESEQAYKLTGLITAPNGATATVNFDRTVPEYAVISFEEYMAAEKGATVTVEGIVVGINAHSLNNKYNHLYLMDASGKGGYYCYKLTSDPAEAGIKVGMTVSVSGTVEPYSGMQEIKDGSFQIVDETIKTITPVDVTEKFAAGDPLTNFVAMPVVIKGVNIGAQDLEKDTSQYLYFSIGEEKGYVRTYVSDFINLTINKEGDVYTSPDKATIDAAHAEKFGWTANVTGILVLYGVENPYIIPTSVDCFEYLEFVEKTADEKLAAELEGLSVKDSVDENTTLELPLVGQYYDDVKIAWTVDNTAYTIGEDGKLAIALGKEKVTLTLTATLTCGDKTETKTFTVAVSAASTDLYVPKNVETPVKDTAYKFYLAQNKIGQILYFAGKMDGNFLATTKNAADATDVYLEEVEGGLRFYFYEGETKKYIDAHEYTTGKVGVRITDTPSCVWTFDKDLGVLTTTVIEKTWYLGTYNTFNTMSLSETFRISGDKAGDVGKSQFPAYLADLAPATYVPENVETPVKDTAYKFYLAQNKIGQVLYFAGKMDGNFLATTKNAADATDVYLEEVEGGLRLYFYEGETKKYIDAHEYTTGKVGVRITDTPSCVWTFNKDLGVLTTTVIEKTWYLGTYNTFNTMSLSETFRISGDKAGDVGKSQFPAYLANLSLKEVAPKNVETPVKDTAYKFYLAQNKIGQVLYFAGRMDGNFLATTTKISQATDVYLEEVEGGLRLYFYEGETKKYIDAHEYTTGKVGVRITDTPSCVWTFNKDLGVLTTTVIEKTWYLGTYNTFNTMSLSETFRISGDKAGDVGKSQFPAYLATIEIVTEEEEDKVVDTDPSNPVCSLPVANIRPDGADVVVTGTVTADDKNNSVTIKDADGNTLYIYKLATPVAKGDVITVTGKMATYKGSRQVAEGATAVINTAHTCDYDAATCLVAEICKLCGATKEGSTTIDHTWVDASCTAPKTCSVCYTTEGDKLAHTYGDDGKCACGITNGQSIVVVNFANYAAANKWENGKMQNTVNADANITFTASSTNLEVQNGNNTGKYYVSDSTWRIYQADAPVVTVKAAEGKTIKSVKVTFTVKNEGAFAIGETIVSSGELITVDANSVSFTVINDGTGTKTNGQVLITAIEVIYE